MIDEFEGIAAKCQVYFFETFWHVHINMKQSTNSDLLIDFMHDISGTTITPIMFTSATSGEQTWMVRGQREVPFGGIPAIVRLNGPHVYLNPNGHAHDVNTVGQLQLLSIDSTMQSVRWSDPPNKDAPHVFNAQRLQSRSWDASSMSIDKATFQEPLEDVWNILSKSFRNGQIVRRYNHIYTTWYDRINPVKRPVHVIDYNVHETGLIIGGKLTVVRVIPNREQNWGYYDDDALVHTPDRLDGPARVVLHGCKEIITSDILNAKRDFRYYGHYRHVWAINGKEISQTYLDKWCKNEGVILRQGALNQQSSFLNKMDQMAWIAHWNREVS